MTREEAINVLRNTCLIAGRVNGKTVFAEALNMAIRALETQPDGDAISRQAVFNTVTEYRNQLCEIFGDENELIRVVDIVKHRIIALSSAQPEQTRVFVELVVEYPDPELCTYKKYKGKPYYSIKYIENGRTYVGYGTYNPKVLSQYLKEYFISSAQPGPELTELLVNCPKCGHTMFVIDKDTLVRCEDCKYRDPEDKKCDCGHDIVWNLPRQDDWFCADAKRRTDESD